MRIFVENPTIQEHLIVRDGHSLPHDAVEYHSFVFSTTNSQGAIPVRKVKDPLVVEISEKHRVLEERLKAIEGNVAFDMDVLDMCLVPNLIIPLKFKTLGFEKYKRIRCQKIHLKIYFRKMVGSSRNDKLLIHCFHDSLSGASLEWYMQLKQSHIHT